MRSFKMLEGIVIPCVRNSHTILRCKRYSVVRCCFFLELFRLRRWTFLKFKSFPFCLAPSPLFTDKGSCLSDVRWQVRGQGVINVIKGCQFIRQHQQFCMVFSMVFVSHISEISTSPPPPRFERPILESTLEVEDRVVSRWRMVKGDSNGCF